MELQGLAKKGMSLSRSSPSLAACFSLREYSQTRKRLSMPRSDSQPEVVLEEIDRLGGNGKWRQRKADDYFKQKQIEELEKLREQRALEEKRRERRRELETKRRRQQEEDQQKRLATQERERREREERERKEKRRREKDRRQQEADARELAAREPVPCELCELSGVCKACDGKGILWATFLAPTAGAKTMSSMDFGRAPQGCEACGGCRQNIMGALVSGSGQCAACNGKGKVWPQAAFEPFKGGRTRYRFSSNAGPGGGEGGSSPKSALLKASLYATCG